MADPSSTYATRPALSGWPLIAVALFLVIVWGSAYTMIGVAVRTLSPEWLVSYRMMFGAALVILFCKLKGYRLPPITDIRWRWYSVMAIFGASLPFVLIANGQRTVDSGLTAILSGTMPLITIILAHFFTEERLNRWKLFGFVMGFVGIIILFLPKDLSPSLVADWKAQLLILAAAACYAITTIIAARAPETSSPAAAAMLLTMGALLSTIWALGTTAPPPMPDMTALLCILALGLGSTGIATITYLWVIDRAGPSVMAKLNYFVPVASVFFGVTLLGEVLDWRIFVSFAIIIIGLMISRIGQSRAS